MRPDLALRPALNRCSYPLTLFLRGLDVSSPAESWPPHRNGSKRRVTAER